MFSEYMEVHASKLDKAVWGNDAIINKRRPKEDQPSNGKGEKGGDSGMEEEEDRTSEPEEVHEKEKKKIADEAISDLEVKLLLIYCMYTAYFLANVMNISCQLAVSSPHLFLLPQSVSQYWGAQDPPALGSITVK